MEAIAARNDGVGRRLFVRMALAGAACSLAFSKARADTRLVSHAAAFLLGDQLSLAALLYAQGKAGDESAVRKEFEEGWTHADTPLSMEDL